MKIKQLFMLRNIIIIILFRRGVVGMSCGQFANTCNPGYDKVSNLALAGSRLFKV